MIFVKRAAIFNFDWQERQRCSLTGSTRNHHQIITKSSSNYHQIIIKSSSKSSSNHHQWQERQRCSLTGSTRNHHQSSSKSSSNHHQIIIKIIIKSSSNHHQIIINDRNVNGAVWRDQPDDNRPTPRNRRRGSRYDAQVSRFLPQIPRDIRILTFKYISASLR